VFVARDRGGRIRDEDVDVGERKVVFVSEKRVRESPLNVPRHF
jgi:hypothetical protein